MVGLSIPAQRRRVPAAIARTAAADKLPAITNAAVAPALEVKVIPTIKAFGSQAVVVVSEIAAVVAPKVTT